MAPSTKGDRGHAHCFAYPPLPPNVKLLGFRVVYPPDPPIKGGIALELPSRGLLLSCTQSTSFPSKRSLLFPAANMRAFY